MDTLSPHADNDNPLEKRCTGPCGRMLPATTEYWHKHPGFKNGLQSKCKQCRRLQQIEYYVRPEVIQHRHEQWKEYESRPDVKEHIQKRKKEYRMLPEVREHVRQWHIDYRARPEVKQHSQQVWKEYEKEYYARPEVKLSRRIRCRNQRARKRSVGGAYTVAQIQEQLKRQHYRCYYAACGHAKFEKVNGKYSFHIEHTYPLSRVAGMDIPANSIDYVVLACPSCNLKKGNKYPHEWPEGGRLL